MSIAIILSKNPIETADKRVFHTLVLSDTSTAFVSEEEYQKLNVGQTVVCTRKKYKSKTGEWKSSTIITPISLAV